MATSFKYEIKYGLVRITEIESDEEVISIPAKIDGKNVYKICEHSLISLPCKSLKLPETIGEVDDDAFIDLYNLKTFECFNIDNINLPFRGDVSKVNVISHSSKVAGILDANYKFKSVKYDKDFKWKALDESLKECEITGFNVRGNKLIFPDTIEGYKVVKIKGKVNHEKHNLTKVKFPKYLREIPDSFLKFQEKVLITLPETLEVIGEDAFYETDFKNKEIIFPDTLREIKEGAFFHCFYISKTKLIFNSNDLYIDTHSFERRTISFEDNVHLHINGKENFWNCIIDKITFHSCNKKLGDSCFIQSDLYEFKGFENVEELDNFVFCGSKFFGLYRLDLSNIKKMGESCFQASNVLEFYVPKDLELLIGAFAYSQVRRVDFDPLYTKNSLPVKCFKNCEFLEEINLPESITTIKEGCFAETSLSKINLEKVETIGEKAFIYTNLKEVNLLNIQTIGPLAFYHCSNLETADISSNKIHYLPRDCFENSTSLKKVILGENLDTLHSSCFSTCFKLEDIDLSNVKLIQSNCFMYCNLKEANLSSIVKLGNGAFEDCNKLNKVTLSKELTVLNCGVFKDCTRLKSLDVSNIKYFEDECLAGSGIREIVFSRDTEKISSNALRNSKVRKMYFSQNWFYLKQDVLWGLDYLETLYIDIANCIPPNFVSYNRSIKTIVFTERVPRIGNFAINNCFNLRKVVVKNKDTEFLNGNFSSCEYLDTLYIDNEETFNKLSKRKSNNISIRKDVSKFKDVF